MLTYPPAEFILLPGYVPFVKPINPGQNPPVPPGATAEQIWIIVLAHANNLWDFQIYRATDNALKQQLLAAVPLVVLQILQHPQLGFALVTMMTLLTHLRSVFGNIAPADIIADNNAMTSTIVWQPTMPIQNIWTTIKDMPDFAMAGGAPISEVLMVQVAYNNLKACGLFLEGCREWRKRLPTQNTYAELICFFEREDLDRNPVTASAFGFHGVMAATTKKLVSSEIQELQVTKLIMLEKQNGATLKQGQLSHS